MPPRRKEKGPPRRRKRTLSLGMEASIRLSIEAERRGCDRSTVADQLINQALRHIVVSIRGGEAGASESAA